LDTHISIGQVKRDISELVNRVAYKGERIVLTSRGRPKAALVSLEDLDRLKLGEISETARAEWLANANSLAARILRERGNELLDVDSLLANDRADLEGQDGE
jgi:prevent-host-death family protein